MALIGINRPGQPREKASPLEKVAAVTGIIRDVLGTAVAIPQFLQEREATNQEMQLRKQRDQREQAEQALNVAEKTRAAGSQDIQGATREKDGVLTGGSFSDRVVQVPGFGARVPLQEQVGPPKTRFGQFRQSVENALGSGMVFVERGGRLEAVTPESVRDNERPLKSFDDVFQADENIKREQREKGIVIRESVFENETERKQRRDREDAIDDVVSNNRKAIGKIDDEIVAMLNAQDLINANSTISEFGLGRVLAKGVFGESGRLTDQDVLQFVPTSLMGASQKVLNWFSGRPTGALTDDQIGAIKRTLGNMLKAKRISQAAMAFENLNKARNKSILNGSDTLQDYERSVIDRYGKGSEDALREAKQIKDARVKLASTEPGSTLRFDGEDVTWEQLRTATDAAQERWLRLR